ncbi:MAG: hypothetical protein AAF637_12335, partial [Pseudomonadota bacterium]
VLQTLLVKRVAAAAWRMQRAERIEVEIFAENALPDGGPGLAMIRDSNRARAFETLVRYRGGTMAEFWRSLRTLKALQVAAPPGETKAAGLAAPALQVAAPQARVAGPQTDLVEPLAPSRPNEPKGPGNPNNFGQPTVRMEPRKSAPSSSPPARGASLLEGTALVQPGQQSAFLDGAPQGQLGPVTTGEASRPAGIGSTPPQVPCRPQLDP